MISFQIESSAKGRAAPGSRIKPVFEPGHPSMDLPCVPDVFLDQEDYLGQAVDPKEILPDLNDSIHELGPDTGGQSEIALNGNNQVGPFMCISCCI